MTNDSRVEDAMALLATGHSCSEALLLSYAGDYGLAPALATKLATGFSGGMGEGAGTCGVVTAACLVIGLAAGPENQKDLDSGRGKVAALMSSFKEGFQATHGSLACMDLNGGFNPATPHGKEGIRTSGRVPILVTEAIEILEGLLDR